MGQYLILLYEDEASWAAVGDAAAAMDPLSSHGLTTSLWSAARGGAAVRSWLDGDRAPLDSYSLAVAAGVRQYGEEQTWVYGQERRFSGRPFWSRRNSSEFGNRRSPVPQ